MPIPLGMAEAPHFAATPHRIRCVPLKRSGWRSKDAKARSESLRPSTPGLAPRSSTLQDIAFS
jgi:hypothetical protein